jgi:AcrR family transcriptional regulator
LLDAAATLAAEQGFHALSVEAVARAAGVTRAVIYRHFSDLPALLGELVDREMARAAEQVAATTPSELGDDPAAVLLASLAAFLTAVHAHPATWRLVLVPPEGAPEALRQHIAQGRAVVLGRLTAAVQQFDTGHDRAHAELTARLLSAVSDEYARLTLEDPQAWPPERLLEHAGWLLAGGALRR